MVRLRWFRAPASMGGALRRRWARIRGDHLPHALALLWLLHIQVLFALDTAAVRMGNGAQPLPARYYIVQSLPPLFFLGLALIGPIATRLGSRLLAVMLMAMIILPLILTPLTIDEPTKGLLMASADAMGFRMVPLHMLAFLILALRYRWPQVASLCLGIGATLVIMNRLTWTQMPPGSIALYLIWFLINGRFVTVLVDRLRDRTDALAQANQQLRHYASTLEQLTVSRERNRMARELHDTLAHTLADLTVQMETAKAYVSVNPETTREILDTALISARGGLRDTRRSLKSLRASPLVELGLAAALEDLARATADAADVRLDLVIDAALPVLPPDTEQAVYRIAQEALANVKYHAGAARLSVALTIAGGTLRLVIRDDGRGFQRQAPVAAGHYGLAGMEEGAQIIGGTLQITSVPDNGTAVEIEIGGGS